jgi:hypothetical protein
LELYFNIIKSITVRRINNLMHHQPISYQIG